jgi:phosphohistidine phosphatase
MHTLSLFRHAKSAWDQEGMRDFDRPLAPRGRGAAPAMGKFMAAHKLVPDIVICSTAVRARETLALALPAFGKQPGIEYSDRLYMASPQQMLRTVRGLSDKIGHAMLVGHNPGMHAFAVALAGEGKSADMNALETKFPTAALAVIDFEAPWQDIFSGMGRLRLFMVPKELPEA